MFPSVKSIRWVTHRPDRRTDPDFSRAPWALLTACRFALSAVHCVLQAAKRIKFTVKGYFDAQDVAWAPDLEFLKAHTSMYGTRLSASHAHSMQATATVVEASSAPAAPEAPLPAYTPFPKAEDGRTITFRFITEEYDEAETAAEKGGVDIKEVRKSAAGGEVASQYASDGPLLRRPSMQIIELAGKRILQSVAIEYLGAIGSHTACSHCLWLEVRRGSDPILAAAWEPKENLSCIAAMIDAFEEENMADLAR